MPDFKIVDNIDLVPQTNAAKFASKGRVVSEDGKAVSSGYTGRRYQIVAKTERTFSCLERVWRYIQAVFAVITSFGRDLHSKSVTDLFTNQKETTRFGIPVPVTSTGVQEKDFSSYIEAGKLGDIPSESPMKTIGSVFNLSKEGVNFFTNHRLYPQPQNVQSLYGCSSMSGFLAQGEDLISCCEKDKKVLESRKISYKTLGERLRAIYSAALEKGTEQLIEGKFKVTLDDASACSQFCPFSPVSDHDASPFAPIKNACGQSSRSIEIKNTKNGKSITCSTLVFHLIEEHNFFEGSVSHRLDPADIIDTLELQPEDQFSLALSPPLPRPPSESVQKRWQFSGLCPTDKETLELIREEKKFKVLELCDGVSAVMLPFDLWGRPNPPMVSCLHVFNLSDEAKTVSAVFEGTSLKDLCIPPQKAVCLLLDNRSS